MEKWFYKYKIKFFLVLVLITFLYLMKYLLVEYTINFHRIEVGKMIQKESAHQTFVIYTPTCKIPSYDPFDSEILPYVNNVTSPCKNRSRLIFSNETSLIFDNYTFAKYNITKLEDIDCYYQDFWRITPKKDEKDNKNKFGVKVNFQKNVQIDKEFIKVECSSENKTIFKDYYDFIKVRGGEKVKANKHNVLIIGLDAVSRLNFHRGLPKTLEYIKQLGAIEYFGYNKVADNTFPNLVPILTGMHVQELKKTCWPEENMHFDNCSKYILWKNYHDKRYATAYGEDGSWMGTFLYAKKGFKEQPVDHMYGVLDNVAQADIGHGGGNAKICQGERFTVEYLLEHAYKFTKAYNLAKRNYFGLFWQNSISHDTINYDPRADLIYKEFFEKLQHLKILEDTFVFIVSDHGIRWGQILNTFQGRLEERLPFFAVIAPNNFKKGHLKALRNLEENSKKLTTPFDFHDTLQAIVDENFSTNNTKTTRGYSLFEPIPLNRTCELAGIPPHWCTCQNSKPIETNSTIVVSAAKFVVSEINVLLSNHTFCAPVILDQILDASVSETNIKEKDIKKILYYTVVLRSLFVGAIFEATVKCKKCDGSDFVMAGDISRHNLYGHQGDCVDDARLRLFCYCKPNIY